MIGLSSLARTETRLFLRDRIPVAFVVTHPALVLAALGAIPALREPSEKFGGLRFIEFFAPSLLVVSVALLGMQVLPVGLVTYRERGVLRRFAATPASPAGVLLVQLVINLVAAVVASVLMVAVAVLLLDVPMPRDPLGFAVAFALGVAAAFALGLVVAAMAPRTKVATGIGTVLFMVAMLFGGVYLPKFLLPDLILRIGEFVPPGVGAISDAWLGNGPQPAQLVGMAVIALAATLAAVRFFRWE